MVVGIRGIGGAFMLLGFYMVVGDGCDSLDNQVWGSYDYGRWLWSLVV